MRTIDAVLKILREIGSDPLSYTDTQHISTDEIVSILLNKSEFEYLRINSELRANAVLDYYYPLHSNRKIIGRLIVLFRRIVRRLLRFLFLPILEQQSAFNVQTIAMLEANRNEYRAIQASLVELKGQFKAQHGENLEKAGKGT